jgi:CubicO group peptidase (beta-lactamase class C family)
MMQKMLTLCMTALLSTAVAPAQAEPYRDAFQSVTPTSFDSGGAVSRQFHLNAGAYIRTATIHRRNVARELPVTLRPDIASAPVEHRLGTTAFAEYVARDPLIDGVVVLHRGNIVFEAYPNMQPWERHYAWSVTKVLTAATLAVLVGEGRVDLSAPVERYVPELAGTAWDGTSVGNVLHMASGIDCLDSDGYQTSTTCVYTMEESLGITAPTGRDPDFMTHLRSMQRLRPAGEAFEYVSANTQVIALVIERVTSQPYASAVESLVWSRLGAEADAYVSVSRQGYAYASGGLSARLRDIARLGQVYADTEVLGVLTEAQVSAMATAGVALAGAETGKGGVQAQDDATSRAAWQWDAIWGDGAMYKRGYLGQGLYVDNARDLVVAWFGTGLDYDATNHELLSVTRQLVRAGLFADSP